MLGMMLAACHEPGTTPTAPGPTVRQGIVAPVRGLDGSPLPLATVYAGSGTEAIPDASSTTYFFDLSPGRGPVHAELAGHPWAGLAPDVAVEGVVAADVRIGPEGEVFTGDGAAGGTFAFGGVTVEIPPGSTIDEAGAPLGVFTATAFVPGEAERATIPADQQLLSNDDQLGPMTLRHAWFFEVADAAGGRADVAPEALVTVTVALPPGDPLFDADEVRAAAYSRSVGWWTRGLEAVLDPVAGTATVDVRGFGWLALVEPTAPACVTGEVRGPRGPVPGAELRLLRAGPFGVDRATADASGRVCVPAGDARWSALGYDDTLETLFTGSGQATIADGFVVEVEAWDDADGDRAFAGPGGDCDDDDPAVSPNPASGDGSWCGSDW